jgi:hypothetical protein
MCIIDALRAGGCDWWSYCHCSDMKRAAVEYMALVCLTVKLAIVELAALGWMHVVGLTAGLAAGLVTDMADGGSSVTPGDHVHPYRTDCSWTARIHIGCTLAPVTSCHPFRMGCSSGRAASYCPYYMGCPSDLAASSRPCHTGCCAVKAAPSWMAEACLNWHPACSVEAGSGCALCVSGLGILFPGV